MRWVSAISTLPDLDAALADVADQAARELEQLEPDLAFVFLHASHASAAHRVAARLESWLGAGLLVGVTAHGVAGGGREVEGEPAVALLAGVLPGVELEARHVPQELLTVPAADAVAWRALLGVEVPDPAFVVFADPYSIDVDALVAGLDWAHPSAPKVGGLASGGRQPGADAGGHALLLGADVYTEGAVVLAIGGQVGFGTIVSQGCRPIGEPHFVTACHEHLLRELDGRSPREVLTRLHEQLTPEDQALFTDSLFVGLALPGEHREMRAGDFLVRNILGLDPDTGALWISSELEPNSILQFHLRDAATASAELDRRLQEFRARGLAHGASAALMISCTGRGAPLHGRTGHDTQAFQRALPDVPVAGFFGAGEIGPIGATTYVHGYTTAFGVFRRRG